MKQEVYIEIPKNSKCKYEYCYDKKTLIIDRYLGQSYPFNYGFVPNTLWEDGDALDAIVFCEEPIVAGSILKANPIGYFEMYDNGISDFKLVFSLGQVDLEEEIKKAKEFLTTYKLGVSVLNYCRNKIKILDVIRKAKK